LAQRRETEYVAFYKKRKEEGDFIILDNGAYEDEIVDTARLIQMAREYGADVVVLPDFPGEPSDKTFHNAMRLVADFYQPPWEWMAVPQASKSGARWMECLVQFLSEDRIKWIGLPRNMNYFYTDDPTFRISIARFLQRNHPDKLVHALGMDRGNYHELWYLQEAGVRSIDSSAPVWRGLNGYSLEHFEDWDETPIDWNIQLPTSSLTSVAYTNLKLCGVTTRG
jgi:hypothetical protein